MQFVESVSWISKWTSGNIFNPTHCCGVWGVCSHYTSMNGEKSKYLIQILMWTSDCACILQDAPRIVSLRGGQFQPLPVAEQHLRAVSGRGAGAVSGHSQGEGGVFQIPGAAAEDPTGGQGGSVHLHPRYAGERRVKCSGTQVSVLKKLCLFLLFPTH